MYVFIPASNQVSITVSHHGDKEWSRLEDQTYFWTVLILQCKSQVHLTWVLRTIYIWRISLGSCPIKSHW